MFFKLINFFYKLVQPTIQGVIKQRNLSVNRIVMWCIRGDSRRLLLTVIQCTVGNAQLVKHWTSTPRVGGRGCSDCMFLSFINFFYKLVPGWGFSHCISL